jgi:hypothetical protein
MPSISRFHGITIRMFFDENFHPGHPHFHAVYAGIVASFEIVGFKCIAGVLPPRVMQMVKKWASRHEDELMANWARARDHRPLRPVDPLR